MKILFVSVGKEEYNFHRMIASFLNEKGWEANFVTLGCYNLDYQDPPLDTVIVEKEVSQIFSPSFQPTNGFEERIHRIEREFDIPCIQRICSTDRIHRHRVKTEGDFALLAALYFEFWDAYLSKHSFEIGFMDHGGELLRWSVYHQCKKWRIPFYQIFFCPIPNRSFLIKNMDYKIEGVDWSKKVEVTEEERRELLPILRNLREGRSDYMRIHQVDFHPVMPLLFLRAYFRKYFTKKPGYKSANLWQYTKDHFWKIVRKHLMKLLYSQPDWNEKYIFFPIHHSDDAQLLIRAPQYANQFALIEMVAKALPYGYKLYIKEHPCLIGGFSFLNLKALKKKCPQIRIVSPLCHPHKLIRHAQAVATINSTAGFESILFQKPLMVFGKAFYRGAGFSVDVYGLEDLPEKIRETLARQPASDEDIIQFLAQIRRNSYDAKIMGFDFSKENARKYSVILLERPELRDTA